MAMTLHRDGFEEHVKRSVELLGFLCKRGGWPDFVVFGQDGSVKAIIEVKSPRDYVRPHQRVIHDLLRAAGLDVRVVREEDLDTFLRDMEVLDRGTPPSPPPGPVTEDDVSEAISRLSYCDERGAGYATGDQSG